MYVKIFLIGKELPIELNGVELDDKSCTDHMTVYNGKKENLFSRVKHKFMNVNVHQIEEYPEDRIKMTATIGSELKVRYVEDDKEIAFLMEAGWTKE